MFKRIWAVIVAVFRQLWSIIADKHWDADPWKIGGWAAFIFAGWLAVQAVGQIVAGHDGTVIAGLAGGFITVGTFLFGQAVQSDKNLPDKPQGGA